MIRGLCSYPDDVEAFFSCAFLSRSWNSQGEDGFDIVWTAAETIYHAIKK
jgi:hypothetical protein